MIFPWLYLLACYFLGSIPFAYIIARSKGVNLYAVGSGNIGATNIGRVLGRPYFFLVFVLDFCKGALPVAFVPVMHEAPDHPGISKPILQVLCSVAVFMGHLFPIYLKFKGGKGVATGAGAVSVLMPWPFLAAVLTWILVLLTSRKVSLASIMAVIILSGCQVLWATAEPSLHSQKSSAGDDISITIFCVLASALVILKHYQNINRMIKGTENQVKDSPLLRYCHDTLHLMALALWLGGSVMFNFLAAPAIFASFEVVVESAPSDRTAQLSIVPPASSAATKKRLASALAGSAVGPIFPKYFLLLACCSTIVLFTALRWRNCNEGQRRLHTTRYYLALCAVILIGLSWILSDYVSQLRILRFSVDPEVAETARQSFGPWHALSLLSSFVITILAVLLLGLARFIPYTQSPPATTDPT